MPAAQPTPASASQRDNRVYGPRDRIRINLIALVIFLGPIGLSLALIGIWAPGGPLEAAIAIYGLVLSISAMIWACARGWFIFVARLRERLRAKIEGTCHVGTRNAQMVGISPGTQARSYHGDTSWDVGFLLLEPGRLTYRGDAATFELRPEQVRNAEVRSAIKLPFLSIPAVALTWSAEPDSPVQTLMLEVWAGASWREMRERTRTLAQELEAWRCASTCSAPPNEGLGLPPTLESIGRVSAPLPAMQMSWKGWLLVFAVIIVAAFGCGALSAKVLGKHSPLERPVRIAMVVAILLAVNAVAIWLRRHKRPHGGTDQTAPE